MTETTKKEAIMASLIFSSEEGAAREREEQLVIEPCCPRENSLFASVPIDGDSGDDGLAGALPFAVAHGQPRNEKVVCDETGREQATSELGDAPFVGTAMRSGSNQPVGSTLAEIHSHSPNNVIDQQGPRLEELRHCGILSSGEHEEECLASSGNGGAQPNQVSIVQQNQKKPTSVGYCVQEDRGCQPSGGVGMYSTLAARHALPRPNDSDIVAPPPQGSSETPLYSYQQEGSISVGQIRPTTFIQASQGALSQHHSATNYPSYVAEQSQALNHSSISRLNLNSRLGIRSTTHGSPLAIARLVVSEPLLISSSGVSLFGIRQPPHWSYQIQTMFQSSSAGPMGCWVVRRRFRHVVALEERLRQEYPGSILPPR
jgi:hypothetical protein